jgi:hypothetical protein
VVAHSADAQGRNSVIEWAASVGMYDNAPLIKTPSARESRLSGDFPGTQTKIRLAIVSPSDS